MTREQAKDILAAYRPGRDDGEPLVTEALALARQDPELQSWHEEQRQLDNVIRAKLQRVEVPEDLLAQIHAGVSARRTNSRRKPLSLATRLQSHWRQLLPLAACLVLLGFLAAPWIKHEREPAGSFANYRSDMAEFLKTFPPLDVQTEKLSEMREWLASQHRLTQIQLPSGLEKYPGIGCRTVQWQHKQLALLCFMVDGEVVHLFVLRASDFPAATLADQPQLAASGPFTTAAWRKADVAYLAMTRGSESFLRALL